MKIQKKGLSPKKQISFTDILDQLLEECKNKDKIALNHLFSLLSGKGYPALLIILALPFCLPIQIPGFSTPFGLILMFMGFRMAFWRRLWWPKWILEKQVSCEEVSKVVGKVKKHFIRLQKFFHPRFYFMMNNQILLRLNGLLIAALAFILALPLPIPMTNLLSAIPIVCIGIGLLENDGLMIMIGYLLAFVWFCLIFAAVFFGLF